MDSEKEKNSCQICGKTFSTPQSRDIHMRTHTGEKPYSSEICSKSFSQSCDKDRHMRTHTGEKPYSCEICEKSFTQSQHKDSHMKTHTGEKPYSCTVCEKSFSQSCHKKRHMRTHTGEKPHLCQICEKSFTTSGDKNRHMKTHIGEKPYSSYSCDICCKSFSQKGHRDTHMRTHTGEKPHLCPICEKSFTTSGDKNRHMKTHIGEKPYSCDICCKSFSQKVNRDTHMKKHTTGMKLDTSDKCSKLFLDVNKHKTVHKDNFNGLLLTMKPVCVKLRKLSPLEIKSLSEINNEQNFDSNSEEETLNKDPLTIQTDGTITIVVVETKEKDLHPINMIGEDIIEENVITTKDEHANKDKASNIKNVKEVIKEEETLANDSFSIKEESPFIDKAGPKLKEDDADIISQSKTKNAEIEVEEEDLVKKYWEEFTSDLPQTNEEEILANDSLSIKE